MRRKVRLPMAAAPRGLRERMREGKENGWGRTIGRDDFDHPARTAAGGDVAQSDQTTGLV
jgi:hypothetical protein